MLLEGSSGQVILMCACCPVQSVGAPERVRVKVSQFTPSTQVLSSMEAPPAALPFQITAAPPGESVPEVGAAAGRAFVGAVFARAAGPRLFAAKVENTSRLKPAKNSKTVANLVEMVVFDLMIYGG